MVVVGDRLTEVKWGTFARAFAWRLTPPMLLNRRRQTFFFVVDIILVNEWWWWCRHCSLTCMSYLTLNPVLLSPLSLSLSLSAVALRRSSPSSPFPCHFDGHQNYHLSKCSPRCTVAPQGKVRLICALINCCNCSSWWSLPPVPGLGTLGNVITYHHLQVVVITVAYRLEALALLLLQPTDCRSQVVVVVVVCK